MESKTIEPEDITKWMDDVKIGGADLPGGKGIVNAIRPPVLKETRFGPRKMSQIVIDGSDGSTIYVNLFLPQQFPMVHPKSN
ncbi:hypothetical protein LCGC14_2792230, partial [marine sediment metagenome]